MGLSMAHSLASLWRGELGSGFGFIKSHVYSSGTSLALTQLPLLSGNRDSAEVLRHRSCRCCHVCAEDGLSLCGI